MFLPGGLADVEKADRSGVVFRVAAPAGLPSVRGIERAKIVAAGFRSRSRMIAAAAAVLVWL